MAKPVENEEKGESFDLDKFRKLLQLMGMPFRNAGSN